MKIGTNEIQKVYLGTTELDGLYLGTTQAYEKAASFDQYTLGVWHLDDSACANSVTTGDYASKVPLNTYDVFTTSYSKFGAGSIQMVRHSGYQKMLNINTSVASADFTIDMWVRTPGGQGANSNSAGSVRFRMAEETAFYLRSESISITGISSRITTTAQTWYHIAVERYNDTIYRYLNGELISSSATTQSANFELSTYYYDSGLPVAPCIDEIRLSNTARYHGQDFTPPTAPY